MCASAVAECMLPGSTFLRMHTCTHLQKTDTETVVKKKKKKEGPLAFISSRLNGSFSGLIP